MKSYIAPSVGDAGDAADAVQECKVIDHPDNGTGPPLLWPSCSVVDLDD